MGDHVDFYEVDGGCARELVALADVRNFPVRIVPLHSAHLCTPQRQLCRHTLCTPMQLASPHSSPRRTGAPCTPSTLLSSAGHANIRTRHATHDAPNQQQGSLRRVQRGPGGPGARVCRLRRDRRRRVIPTRGARKSRVHGVNTCTIACWFLHSTRKVRGKAHHPPDERAKTTDSRLLVLRPDLAVPDPPVGLGSGEGRGRARVVRESHSAHTRYGANG